MMDPAPSLSSINYYVYLLRSKKKDLFYIGYTKNIKKRLDIHNAGLVNYTRKYIPWELTYYEGYISLEDAKAREKNLKYFGKAYTQLKLRLQNSLNKMNILNKKKVRDG